MEKFKICKDDKYLYRNGVISLPLNLYITPEKL